MPRYSATHSTDGGAARRTRSPALIDRRCFAASASSSPWVMVSSPMRSATLSGDASAVACASPWMVPSPRSRTNALMSGSFGRWRRHAARLHSSMLSIVPRATTSDGVGLHWEEFGSGTPILFVHEFAGDHRSWAPQVRHFAQSHRCIVYAARGYPPSDVPRDVSSYSQARAVEDAVSVLNAARTEKAHVVGLSMGGFATLHLVLTHPDRVLSAVVGGVGYGAQPEKQEQFRRESNAIADAFESQGSAVVAESYAVGPARVQLEKKNPEAWREFKQALAQHDATGAANTMRGVQAARPSLYAMQEQLRAVRT